jgi:hypothetical protein
MLKKTAFPMIVILTAIQKNQEATMKKIFSAPTFFVLFLVTVIFAINSSAQGKVYKIGEKGPAGGWVIHDKGDADDGWRYLEAAPEDMGTTSWGCQETPIDEVQETEIGTGKKNTKLIVKGCSEKDIAAKRAAAYKGGGKKDWFLPSKDELNLIYENLYKKGIGGYKAALYWSSSEYAEMSNSAWHHSFRSGVQESTEKETGTGMVVLPVRSFK